MSRKMLSLDRQAKIKDRLTDITKRLRKWPYPVVAPEQELEGIISELEAIVRLNMDKHYGPVTRAVKWQRRAQVIRSRRTPDTITEGSDHDRRDDHDQAGGDGKRHRRQVRLRPAHRGRLALGFRRPHSHHCRTIP